MPTTSRLPALDAARALALAGMLVAHFVSPEAGRGPVALRLLDTVVQGRAAPLFCLLLGVGIGLLGSRPAGDRRLVIRGLVLFAGAVAVWPYVEVVFFILPHYGLFLAAGPLWRRLPDRWCLALAGVAFCVPSVAAALRPASAVIRSGRQPHEYADLREVGRLARFLLWDGGYPMVGWLGFVLVGVWLSRRIGSGSGKGRGRGEWTLLAGGVLVAALQPAAIALERIALDGRGPFSGDDLGWAAFLSTRAHSNHLAWYLTVTGTAVAVVAACALAARWPGFPSPVLHLGQLALTAYAAHIVVGTEWWWPYRLRETPPIEVQMAVAAAVLLALTLGATLWRRRFSRGPLEAALRAAAR